MKHPLIRLGLTASLLLATTAGLAAPLTPGSPAPETLAPAQTLLIKDDVISYKNWLARDLTGKVRVVQHLNAALGVDDINRPFINSLNGLNLDPDSFTTLTVLNTAGVSAFLKKMARFQIEDLQRSNSHSEFVLDTDAQVRVAWGLPAEGASVILVDQTGKIIAHKDGKLAPEDIKEFVSLIQQHLPQ